MKQEYYDGAIALLQKLIATSSLSGEEDETAIHIANWFKGQGIDFHQKLNNVWAINKYFDTSKPTLLLNSHHDTVQANSGYTRNPLEPSIEDGKLFGLGSNDAGGCLVSLLTAFSHFYDHQDLAYNLVMVASAEEENSGPNGLGYMLDHIPSIDVAIVGEPTLMDMAIAEKGLVVFDVKVKGTPSHAAHPNDNNALYNSIAVLQWLRDFRFDKVSDVLGEVKLTVTQISAGKQHNVVPAEVNMVVDVRVNDCYTNKQIVEILKKECPCDEIEARGLRLNSSSIPMEHDLVQSGLSLGMATYGSPTISDQAVLSCPSLKLGPGDSRRSHMADEYIFLKDIEKGIDGYIKLLSTFLLKD